MEPFPEMMFVPTVLFFAPLVSWTPPEAFGTADVPAALRPMMLPKMELLEPATPVFVPVSGLKSSTLTPGPKVPEMTLPAPGALPPMMLLVAALPMPMPPPEGIAAAPPMLRPM